MSTKLSKALFVTHDLNRAGAQIFLLNILKYLKIKDFTLSLLVLENHGDLAHDFSEVATIFFLPQQLRIRHKALGLTLEKVQDKFIKKCVTEGDFDFVYLNTIATSTVFGTIKKHFKGLIYSHIHELHHSLKAYSTEKDLIKKLGESDKIFACSNAVADNLKSFDFVKPAKVFTIHSFVDNQKVLALSANTDKEALIKKYHLDPSKKYIGACGNAEWRKGTDLFIDLVSKFDSNLPYQFLWIGANLEQDYSQIIAKEISNLGLTARIKLIPQTADAIGLISILEVFVLTSREDPFPLVMLEAALCKKPILGFEQTGGATEFVKDNCGLLSPFEDTTDMAKNLESLTQNEALKEQFGQKGFELVNSTYNFEHSVEKLLCLIR